MDLSAPPVPCGFCREPILPGEPRAPFVNMAAHWECGFRAVVGGVNHIRKRCTCCGGTEPPDPPGLSAREAAAAAVAAWEARRSA